MKRVERKKKGIKHDRIVTSQNDEPKFYLLNIPEPVATGTNTGVF